MVGLATSAKLSFHNYKSLSHVINLTGDYHTQTNSNSNVTHTFINGCVFIQYVTLRTHNLLN